MDYDALTLGSLLRLLLERLDRDVEAAYRDSGLAFKPRYTSIFRLLAAKGELRVSEIVSAMGLSQPSVTNSLAAMRKDGLVDVKRGTDGRERLVALSKKALVWREELVHHWARTSVAAESLDTDIGTSLSETVRSALVQLDRRSYRQRIDAVAERGPSSKSNMGRPST